MTKQFIRPFLIGTVCVLLISCATTKPPVTPSPAQTPTVAAPTPQVLSWPQRYSQLSDINHFSVLGSASITHQNKTDLASLSWTQHESANYVLALYGPLSLGHLSITGRPGLVTLQQSGKPTVSAKSAEALMQQQLGWQMPVTNLYYWVRGLAAPGATADFKFDKQNHIVAMTQNGWTINYLGFMQVNHVDLPQKITLSNPNLRATLAIRQWIVAPVAQQVALENK
ncbi:MAG TPA: lipoprotein insertase outer membrane protein LolB [Gammaproteobacteria bacterium]|nr:lipoprotein insertase outer membrane protein LolB [Gammaproteobacteria bacterium]